MAFSKVKDKNFQVIKNEEGNSPAARMKKLIFIIVAVIVVVGISAFLLFSPRGSAPGVVGDSPDAMVRAYSEYVRAFVPPATVSPTQGTVSDWLQFFDRPSQQWFRENASKLAFVGARRDADTWKSWNNARREIEAMKHLISQAPLRGGVVNNIRVDDATNRAAIELKSLDQINRFTLIKESGGWRFMDMMGQRERHEQTLAGVTLP